MEADTAMGFNVETSLDANDYLPDRRGIQRSREGAVAIASHFALDRRGQLRKVREETLFHSLEQGVAEKPLSVWKAAIKRFADVVGSGMGLVLLAPVLLVTMAVVKLTSRGPVFFSQSRVTKGGRIFTMWKFRTMVVNAECLKNDLAARNEMSGPVFKIKNDPRVTSVGRFLRKTSLDELPQLWNVLMGDMSLVGPRPPLPQEVVRYRHWQTRRLAVKTGITCIWQVSGRNNIDFDRWMRLDLNYVEQWSLWLDIKLLWKTVGVVLSKQGAS